MRNLSRESSTVAFYVPRDLARVIGYFAGFDVHLKKGDTFIDYDSRGHTSYQLDDIRYYVGRNFNFHRYMITHVTPKSYVLQYQNSLVNIIHPNDRSHSHKFLTKFRQKVGNSRVFPLRRSKIPCWVSRLQRNVEDVRFLDECIHMSSIRDHLILSF